MARKDGINLNKGTSPILFESWHLSGDLQEMAERSIRISG